MNKRHLFYMALCLLLVGVSVAFASGTKESEAIPRISVEDSKAKVAAGEAMLVCAYDDKGCQDKMLKGAIKSSELEAKAEQLDKSQEIIFYCN